MKYMPKEAQQRKLCLHPSTSDPFHAYILSVSLLIPFKSVSLNHGFCWGSFKNPYAQNPVLEILI